MLKYLLVMLIVYASFVSVSGQTSENERIREEQDKERNRRQRESIQEKKIQEFEKLNRKVLYDRTAQPVTLTKKERKKIKAALAPHPEDLAEYKDFLNLPKTGLFRLMPNLGCNSKYIVSANKDCENSTYAGEYYSFRTGDYASEVFFDLTLKDGALHTGGFLSQAILVNLGDAQALDNISSGTNGLKFLFDFVPQTDNQVVKRQFAEITRGVNFGGYKYSKSEKALLDNTYALRVVAYQIENKLRSNLEDYEITRDKGKFSAAVDDRRVDLTVAFRIIRRDSDGGISVLWKEINKKEAPKIIFKENEQLIDFSSK